MSIQSYISKTTRLEKDIAAIEKSIAAESKKESDNLSRINKIQRSITRSTSLSSIANKNQQLNQYKSQWSDIILKHLQ